MNTNFKTVKEIILSSIQDEMNEFHESFQFIS
jgi:hypothetical protein